MSTESPHLEIQLAQQEFLARGGASQRALTMKYKSGELSRTYEHRDYPKTLRFNERTIEVEQPYYVGNDSTPRISHVTRTFADEITVASETEEAEAAELFEAAEDLGVAFQAGWTLAVLQDAVKTAQRRTGTVHKPRSAPNPLAAHTASPAPAEAPAAHTDARIDRLESLIAGLIASLTPAAPVPAPVPEPDAADAEDEDDLRLAELDARIAALPASPDTQRGKRGPASTRAAA